MCRQIWIVIPTCLALAIVAILHENQLYAAEVGQGRPVTASDSQGQSQPKKVTDGIISDDSRWIGTGGPPWLDIELDGTQTLTAADIYSGYMQSSPVQSVRIQKRVARQWRDIDGGVLIDNDQLAIRVVFEKPVSTSAVRFRFEKPGPQKLARIRELRLWTDEPQNLPPLEEVEKLDRHPSFPTDQHLVFLNQSGFNSNWPKRFTAPQSPDGSIFKITPITDNRVLYVGQVKDQVGDFSSFRPADSELLYQIQLEGAGMRDGSSDPFYVAPMLFQRIALEPALRMFVDDRAATGSHPGAFGCAPWRDSPFYAYSTPSLVNLYLSNPSFFDQRNIEMDFVRDLDRVLDPDFGFDDHCSENAMDILKKLRMEIDPPVGDQVPDIVQLIHWGTAWWYIDPVSKDWAGSDEKLHPETVTIPTFFLYGLPAYEEYFSQKFQDSIRDWTFQHWESAGLFDVQTKIGTFKGRYPPGWTVLPNLMMHEVAKREGRKDSQRYLDAAVAQAKWVIDEVDLDDPLHTKGQRMSEHKTISGLFVLHTHYSDIAPHGLTDFLRQWTDVMIARSENCWDFRKYDKTNWSLPRHMPGMTGGGSSWNEPGNLAGFPFLAWSVASVLGDTPEDELRKQRLEQLAVSHFDNLWGRNPLGAHSAWRGPKDYLGVERGWPVKYRPVCGYLHTTRGALCSSASTEHYPFNPRGDFRHPEGWTAFNAAFNMGLVAANRRDTTIKATLESHSPEIPLSGVLKVELAAPVFAHKASVVVSGRNGDREELPLLATGYQNIEFRGQLDTSLSDPIPSDGVLQYSPGEQITVTYGHGYFSSSTQVSKRK